MDGGAQMPRCLECGSHDSVMDKDSGGTICVSCGIIRRKKMETFNTYDEALEYMRQMKKVITDKNNPLVTVAGPEDEQGTVMTLEEAIENDFLYEF